MKRIYRLVHTLARRNAAHDCQTAPDGWIVSVSEPNRTLEQNAAQWPILQAFAAQKQWVVNGEMVWMTDEEWKDVLTAAFRKEKVRLAQALDGGIVMLGLRTRDFDKKEFSDWLEFLHATAVDRGVTVYEDAELTS